MVRRSSSTRVLGCLRDISASVRRPLHDCAPVASPDVIRADGLRKAAMPEGEAI